MIKYKLRTTIKKKKYQIKIISMLNTRRVFTKTFKVTVAIKINFEIKKKHSRNV